MSCENRREALIERLYGELNAAAEADLDRHLRDCEACRRERDELARTRAWLGEGRPQMPPSPRVLMVASRPARAPWLAFAAGFAAAALLAAGGLAAGWSLARGGGEQVAAAGDPPATTVVREVTPEEFHSALSEYRNRIEQLESARRRPAVDRDELQAQLARLAREIDERRAIDLEAMWATWAGEQVRTNSRVEETRETMRYLLLAGDPRFTEQ